MARELYRAFSPGTMGSLTVPNRLVRSSTWDGFALSHSVTEDHLGVYKELAAGGGTEAALQGKDLNGTLVVMDWDCDLEWLSVPEFGGKAVVFRGNRPADGRLARRKFLSMPVDIPRFYVSPDDLPALDAALAAKASARFE